MKNPHVHLPSLPQRSKAKSTYRHTDLLLEFVEQCWYFLFCFLCVFHDAWHFTVSQGFYDMSSQLVLQPKCSCSRVDSSLLFTNFTCFLVWSCTGGCLESEFGLIDWYTSLQHFVPLTPTCGTSFLFSCGKKLKKTNWPCFCAAETQRATGRGRKWIVT